MFQHDLSSVLNSRRINVFAVGLMNFEQRGIENGLPNFSGLLLGALILAGLKF
jgi:hypothetical protein